MKSPILPAVVVPLFISLTTHAEPLVYEGFDPSDPAAVLAAGQLAGATSKGFAADSKWAVTGSDDYTADFTGEGLSMQGLAATGGAVNLGVGGSSKLGGVNIYRQSGVSVPAGSTFYGSFLFRNNQTESRYLTFLGVETGEDLPDDKGATRGAHRVADNDAAMLFTVSPDSFARDEEGVPGRASQGIKIWRSAAHGSKEMAQAEQPLNNGETYLVVWRVANAAGTEHAAGGAQQATMWILSQDNLNAVRAAGEPTEQALDSNNVARIAVDKGLRARLLESDFINIGATIGGGNKQSSSVYDEIRIGADMASVLPAP